MKKIKITKFKLSTNLKCPKCKKKNVTQALFCYKCGYRFKEPEIKEAKENGLAVYIKMFFDWTDKFKFTDWKIWKIASILFIIYTGIRYVYLNGYHLKLEKSNDYVYTYNKDANEYYLYLNNDSNNIKLYVPHEAKQLYVYHYNENNEVIDKKVFQNLNNIVLSADNDNNHYYILALNEKENKSNEVIKVLTYSNINEVNNNE